MSSNWKTNRRTFLQGGLLAAFGLRSTLNLQSSQASQAASLSASPLHEFSYGAVQFPDGLHQRQLDDTMAILLNLSEDSLLKPFRLRAGLPAPGADLGGWYDEDPTYDLKSGNEHGFAPGHSFGQWISAFTRAYAINGAQEAKDKAERLISLYAKTISPKFYADFRFPSYTYDKLNLALIDAHKYVGLKDAFAILSKTTDTAEPYLPGKALDHDEMKLLPHKDDSWCWDESYTLPENLFIAFNRGAGERYRELAVQYLKDDTYFNPLSEGKNILPGHHAYSYTNALSSAMQAYLTNGSQKHFQAALNGFDMIHDTQSYATGGWGPNETFCQPDSGELGESLLQQHHSFETPCGSYAHLKLTRYLLRVTGNPKYGDSMEQVMYNTILGAKKLAEDGHAFYYSDYTYDAKKGYREKWTCCSGTLPQVATDYRICSYFRDDNGGVFVNLYIPSTLKWEEEKEKHAASLSLTQKSNYPLDEHIQFTLTASRPTEFSLHLRIPDWAEGATIHLNGNKVPAGELIKPATTGGFACIQREWQARDRIELELPLKIRLQAIDTKHPNIVALRRGPLVLFPVKKVKPQITKEQLLAVKRKSNDEWLVETTDGPLSLRPFTSIADEQYSTYFQLI